MVAALFQVVLFSVPPLIAWLLSQRSETFFQSVGLKWPLISKKLISAAALTLLIFLALGFATRHLLAGIELANSQFTNLNFKALIAILIYAFIKTALAEEIFFRGFLLKRLQQRLGFLPANLIQAVIFGGLHGLLLLTQTTSPLILFISLFTGTVGFVFGGLNEKLAGGSLFPSWLIHGLSNLVSSLWV
ncbi:CPBP family intramembrane glutamic endopeptidase [Enterococcus sp. CSURQ0835]|uniref:CPBP family intramembrane glutamic endopeptidase n=1 Tax=Enterococcus sp. CSURQ0835 TaxID=2681394 RepID=UPI001356832D|nr:CPBP family intramembrane glutamic endopeptidase [Enterococcus sp. CSURQ0835]